MERALGLYSHIAAVYCLVCCIASFALGRAQNGATERQPIKSFAFLFSCASTSVIGEVLFASFNLASSHLSSCCASSLVQNGLIRRIIDTGSTQYASYASHSHIETQVTATSRLLLFRVWGLSFPVSVSAPIARLGTPQKDNLSSDRLLDKVLSIMYVRRSICVLPCLSARVTTAVPL